MALCKECHKREVSPEDEFGPHDYCYRCEDDLIDTANERREWEYYHSDP